MENNGQQVSESQINLVIARLDASSPDLCFSSGDGLVTCSRDEMIEHVKVMDEIGRSFVAEQLEFLRAFKDGSLLEMISKNL